MQIANTLEEQHQSLANNFASLAQERGDLPVFSIEHGLDELALAAARQAVSLRVEEDPHLESAAWAWSYLPLIVIATETGYRYRGTGTDFWPLLAQDLRNEAGQAFRTGLSRLFELGHRSFRLARPGGSPWERQFPHISWPIVNSLAPLEIQSQLTDALRSAVRAGISANDPVRLLDYMQMLAAGHSSRRFETWLLQRDVAPEVMRRLLDPDSEGWLSKAVLRRIDRDIRKDRGAYRAIAEARKTVAKRPARPIQVAPSRYVLALNDRTKPYQLIIRGPALSAQRRDEVIAALRIHGDRIRAADGAHSIALGSFLAGGEITLNNVFPVPESPLRRDDAIDLDEEAANVALERLQPLEPEFFLVEAGGRTARSVFPEDELQPDFRIIQWLRTDDEGICETRFLEASDPADIKLLRRRGFSIAERPAKLQLLGLPVPGSAFTFCRGFPVFASLRGTASAVLLLDGTAATGRTTSIRGIEWTAFHPDIGRHGVEAVEGKERDRLEFEVIEPTEIDPAAVKILPHNANVSDLLSGHLEIRVTAPLPLESVRICIRVISADEPDIVATGALDRLPARLTGRSPVLREIQMQLSGRRAIDSGLRLSVDVEGLLETAHLLPPARRELRYDGDTGKWTGSVEEDREIASIGATPASPLLGPLDQHNVATRLVLPDAADHEALPSGLILGGMPSARPGLGERRSISLPVLLREPASNEDGVGLSALARANVAWQLAQASDLLGNWQRWTVVEELEAALVEQLCGARWRRLESGVDLSMLSQHGALLRCAQPLGLVSGKDLPLIETPSDRQFLQERMIARFKEAAPDVTEALLHWNADLAGDLDLAVIEAYEDLRKHLEASGMKPFEEADMSRPEATWRLALERSLEVALLPMFRPFILPAARWSALIKPWYAELSEDDLVDLLDSCHADASRRPGVRWFGRPELRTMLQLWLSPKTMVETDGWRDLLAKGLSDTRTSRAVRYAALRRKLALGDLLDGSAT